MIKHTVFAVLIGITLFIAYLTWYLGVFQDVKITDGEAPAFHLLAKEHIGPYHKIVAIIQEVEAWAKANNIDCTQSFGLYLNDPRQTEQERLRSWGGCWVSQTEIPNLPDGFFLKTWSAPYFVKAVFEGSPGIGPYKVYPKIEAYIAQKKWTRTTETLEVYVIHPSNQMTTTYYVPVQR